MVTAESPVRLLINVPDPVPSDVLVVRATVGPVAVLQQMPRAVTGAPPSEVMLPPEVTVVEPIVPAAVVVSVGKTGFTAIVVVKVSSFPYEVPSLLVANALTWYAVPADKPVIALVKAVAPEVSVILLLATVGAAEVLQQIPCEVMVAPPFELTVPPVIAVPGVITETAVVVRVGGVFVMVVLVVQPDKKAIESANAKYLIIFIFISEYILVLQYNVLNVYAKNA